MTEHTPQFPNYVLFLPPEGLELGDRPPREWKPREARKHFDWFVSAIPERLDQLNGAAQDIAERLDYSPESLKVLGQWFCSVVTSRKKTAKEIERELAGMSERARKLGMGINQDWTLTGETFSIAMDVGIYLGEVFRKQFPALKWDLCTRPKRDISYNQPVLEGGKMKIDPIHLVVTMAWGVARRRRDAGSLFELYNIWVSYTDLENASEVAR